MLLNDIGKSPNSTFRKINHHLETNYGFKIAENVSDKDLVAIMEQIEAEITELKVKGNDSKASPEISKRLLVLEGIRSLRESSMTQFQSPDLEHVVNSLADFIQDSFRLSGTTHSDFEECVRDGMKHYRSSRYRFPDQMVEQRVRDMAMSKIHGPVDDQDGQHSPINAVAEAQPILGEEDEEMNFNDINEEKWIKTDPKKKGMFKGKSKSEIDAEKAKLKKKHANQEGPISAAEKTKMHELEFASRAKSKGGLEESQPMGFSGAARSAGQAPRQATGSKLALEPRDAEEEQPKMVKHPRTGRMEVDPFDANRIARQKGIVMKENLVKNLRHLLETEVSQAEVMMAAKGFSQELQEMIEKIGRLQNEDLPPVTDQMRETYGTESSSAFQTQIYSALQGIMDSLYTSKNQIDDSVSSLATTGQVGAQTDMDKDIGIDDGDIGDDMGDDLGADSDVSGEPDLDLDNIGDDLGDEDEFGAQGSEEPLGRSMKAESLQHKVYEMKKLIAKAKKLKEAKNA